MDDLVRRLRHYADQDARGTTLLPPEGLIEEAAARIEQLEAERDRAWNEAIEAENALRAVLNACDQGRMIHRPGAGGMTIEANIRCSIYTGVPAWPIEEAREFLDSRPVRSLAKEAGE
jgi:hypothetical protein